MVYNVTTWEDFRRAFTNPHDTSDPENDVIEILADMDWNEVTMSNPLRAGAIKTINGNNHTIYNLHDGTSKGDAVIRSGNGTTDYVLTWNKLNFDNLFVVMNPYGVFWGAAAKRMIFNDCTFVARVYNELFRYCVLNRCAITFENINAFNTPFQYDESNFCWYNVKIRKTATATTTAIFSTMNTCYIEGKILCPATHAGVLGNLSNCCVNVQTDIPLNKISTNSNTPISIYNSDKIPSVTTADVNMVAVTDVQMHDAQYLESIGFAIIAQAGE